MTHLSIAGFMFTMSVMLFGCGHTAKEKQLERFIEVHIAKVEPLSTLANLAYWDASTTGSPCGQVFPNARSHLTIRLKTWNSFVVNRKN